MRKKNEIQWKDKKKQVVMWEMGEIDRNCMLYSNDSDSDNDNGHSDGDQHVHCDKSARLHVAVFFCNIFHPVT